MKPHHLEYFTVLGKPTRIIDKSTLIKISINFLKKDVSWGGAIALVLILIIIIRSVAEWYFVNVNFADVPHQSGWHFVGMLMQASVVIPASLLISIIAGSFTKVTRIRIFIKSSFIMLALMEFVMAIGSFA
jgi:hypothetical protein